MELIEFIKVTLVQISNGIKEAKQELGNNFESPAIINPKTTGGKNWTESNGEVYRVEEIEFDIAIVVEQNSESNTKIGVITSILSAGASKSVAGVNSETHRIKFKVPIKFP